MPWPSPSVFTPTNPHYFLFRGKPTVLVTSGEHYGAVINLDFKYDVYLDALASDGLNLTRLFVGSYLEKPGDFKIRFNTLAPAPGRAVTPWARSTTDGYAGGGPKFDLDRWDEGYFTRLKDFVAKANARGIVVEVVLFSNWYGKGTMSPLHPSNNVNGLDAVAPDAAHTLANGGLLARQEAMVRKLVAELNAFDNVYFEIQNEPDATSPDTREIPPVAEPRPPARIKVPTAASVAWQATVVGWIVDEERRLPQRHLIAQGFANHGVVLDTVDPRVSVINFHYALPESVTWNLGLNRPIAFDESGFAGHDDSLYRRQAWRFLMAGGAVFSGLDYSFAVGFEKGTAENDAPGGGSAALRSQLGVLKRTLDATGLIGMRPDRDVVVSAPGAAAVALSRPGRHYLIYLEGPGKTDLTVRLPAGRYQATWSNARTGRTERQESVTGGGNRLLESPDYVTDVVLSDSTELNVTRVPECRGCRACARTSQGRRMNARTCNPDAILAPCTLDMPCTWPPAPRWLLQLRRQHRPAHLRQRRRDLDGLARVGGDPERRRAGFALGAGHLRPSTP